MSRQKILRLASQSFSLVVALLVFSHHVYAKREAKGSLRIVDYQKNLNRRFKKHVRAETRFIIVHSTESRLPSALRTLSKGRVRHGRYITHGGHAHYLIARDGAIYRILDPKYWANHAGVSMWDGLTNLSDYSVGIEMEGYYNVPFEEAQYRSLRILLDQLKQRYGVADRDVLEHCRIAYSKPNRFHRNSARGRKSDPGLGNFDRPKAGLMDEYPQDPDVIAGRMKGSPELVRTGSPITAQIEEEEEDEEEAVVEAAMKPSPPRTLSRKQTAWKVAGAQYNAPTTVYRFPNGEVLSGDQIQDWSDLPSGTQIQMNVPSERGGEGVIPKPGEKKVVSAQRAEVVVPEVTAAMTPWKIANALMNSPITFYIFPDGTLHSGDSLRDPAAVPMGSKVLVAYRRISRFRTKSKLGEDLEEIYLDPRTLYLFPDRTLKSGDQISDFTAIPPQTQVYAKVD